MEGKGKPVKEMSMEGMEQVDKEKLVKDYLASGKDSLSIVISGKMGVGKSALINGLIGEKVANEATSPLTETTISESFIRKVIIGGVKERTVTIAVNDTPGLADPFGEADQADNLDQIAEKCKQGDLLIYCMDMRGRLGNEDIDGLRSLQDAVGVKLWNNTMLVLTFANEIKPSPGNPMRRKVYYEEHLENWRKAITQNMLYKTLKLPPAIVDNISIVPTGYCESSPPDGVNWLTRFWIEAFDTAKKEAQPVLLGMNVNRLTAQPTCQPSLPVDKQLKPEQQQIHLMEGVEDAERVRTEVEGKEGTALLAGMMSSKSHPKGWVRKLISQIEAFGAKKK